MPTLHKAVLVLLAAALLSGATGADAQPVVRGVEDIDSDRPEAWAIRYFTSVTLLNGLTVPGGRRPGSVQVGVETVWIPPLSTEKQRVGFNGTKAEDLNQAPVFVRPRVTVGLSDGLAATLAFVPPVETFGVRAGLVAAALDRRLHESDAWALGGRVYGQVGSVRAAVTCPADVLAFAPGSPQNGAGCLQTSEDVARLRYAGLELGLGVRPRSRVTPRLALSANWFDNRFEANALRFDVLDRGIREPFIDRTTQRSRGVSFACTGGLGLRLGERVDGAIDVFYAPLLVKRQAGAPRRNDGLLNAKVLIRYRLR